MKYKNRPIAKFKKIILVKGSQWMGFWSFVPVIQLTLSSERLRLSFIWMKWNCFIEGRKVYGNK